MSENRLTRSENDRVIAGICGGIAEYLEIEPILVRALFVLLTFASGMGVIIYLVLWFIMPQGGTSDTGTAVIKGNFDEMGQTVSSNAKRIGQPGAVGVILVLLGAFFLLNQIGGFGWLAGLFWPLVIIGVGVYLVSRRNRRN